MGMQTRPTHTPRLRPMMETDVPVIKELIGEYVMDRAVDAVTSGVDLRPEDVYTARVGALVVVALDRLDVLCGAMEKLAAQQRELQRQHARLLQHYQALVDHSQVYQ